jgi:autotransporter-associated beta strand protein
LTAASTSNTVTINPLTVTLNSTTATKVYDGNTSLTGSQITISGLIGGQTLTYTGATANSANVGSGNYITGMTLANGSNGGVASNYALPTLNITNAPVQITKANLVLTGSKLYDGTVSFMASSMAVTGVNGETFTVSGEALLTHKNVQTNQMLSGVSRLLLAETSSGLLSNYNDLTANQTLVSVSVKPINVTVPVITKVYDGTFTYTLNAADLSAMTLQLMGADSFSSATVIYNGNDKNVGANKPITLTSVTINDDNNGGNYSVTYINSGGAITRAPLRVTAVNDAKFVSQTDNSQYAGVLYSGFVNGETSASLDGALGFIRSNAAVNTVGNYVGVLQPAGLTSSNYQITFVPGDYTIVAAENLLVRASANSTYGSAPSYQLTAQYLAADNTTLSYIGFNGTSPSLNVINLTATANRSGIATFTLVDGLVGGTAATISIGPDSATLSGSSNINAGQYNVESAATPTFNSASPSFKGVTVVGQLTVSPMIITSPTLGANSITKEYDGNAVISGNTINTSASSSQLLAGDLASITATGIYSDKNVANGKSVTVNFGLAGTNASNYVMSSTQVTGNYGQITQLNSVTYEGASGGTWSTASNWTGGAIPDYANVANVVIPSNKIVNFDSSVGGIMTSAIQNNGRININLSSDKTFANTITGSGALEISNVGVVTLTGNNTYSGGTILNAGTSLVAGSNNALATGAILSNGTAADPARFMTTSNVVLPSLTITGGTTKLMSSITTVGAQSYADLVLGVSGTNTLASSNGNISLLGKVDSAVNKANDLVINAGTANVTIGDSIGSVARFNNLTVTGRAIYILADVLTGMTQTYNGSVLIGNASYLGKTPTVGFLLSNYRSYFEYNANGRSSAIDYLNRDPIYIRTLISVDPEITFNGAVDDVVANTHTLLVAAIAPTSPASNPAALNGAAVINFNDSVGQEAPLYSVNVQTVLNNSQNNADAYLGSINLTGNVATYSSQTYRANMMTAKSNPQPGEVVFSVWDPAANITYLLPLQDTTNSNCTSNCGQMNLQNPNGLDALKVNGNNNFMASRNSTGVNNWGDRITQANALGYVLPPARSNSEFMNYAKFIQRDVQNRMMKLVDDGDERKASVSVGEAQVDDGAGVNCTSLRKNKKALLPPECRTTKN